MKPTTKHLYRSEAPHAAASVWGEDCWKPGDTAVVPITESDCPTCLRELAKAGALAAVQALAVENIGKADEERVQERDAALEDATIAKRALMARGLFICQECKQTRTLSSQAGHQIPGDPPLIWCTECSRPH